MCPYVCNEKMIRRKVWWIVTCIMIITAEMRHYEYHSDQSISIYIHISIYSSIHLSICLYNYLYVYTTTYILIQLRIYWYNYIYIDTTIYILIQLYIYIDTTIYILIQLSIYIDTIIYIHTSLFTYISYKIISRTHALSVLSCVSIVITLTYGQRNCRIINQIYAIWGWWIVH